MNTVVTEFTDICAICGKPAQCEHHLIYGDYGSQRKAADKDGIKLPMCDKCHNLAVKPVDRIHGNSMAESLSKIAGQLAWEKEYYRQGQDDVARREFMRKYGRSYL